jgi:hypothetical protein
MHVFIAKMVHVVTSEEKSILDSYKSERLFQQQVSKNYIY